MTQTSSTANNDKPTKPGIAELILHHIITVLILVLFVGLGAWSYLNFQSAEFFSSVDQQALQEELQPSLQAAQHSRLQTAIEVYTLLHDRHPPRLDDLVSSGLLMPSDLYYPRGPESWVYEPHSDGFTLSPKPPEPSE